MRRQNKGLCDERCLSCVYHGLLERRSDATLAVYCNYIGVEGHSRGCPAGPLCDKYEPGATPTHGPGIIIFKNGEPRGWWSHD